MGAITLLVGTTKGLFLVSSDVARKDWQVAGPFCEGWTINHAVGDPITGQIWAAGGGEWSGAGVWHSADRQDWRLSKLSDGMVDDWLRNDPDFAKMMGREAADPAPFSGKLEAMWSLKQSGDRIFAGGKPAALYVSDDQGQNWAEVESLSNHPSAQDWQPGAAGLTLHTIIAHPETLDHLWLGISAAGVFASEDGGQSWERRNRLSNAPTCEGHPHPTAPHDGNTGLCVHNMMRASDGTLYQQNHHGTFKSQDGGRSWDDIGAGLPSNFGFPIAVHPEKPQTIWTFPLNGDAIGRFPPDASAAVSRSRDGGTSWQDCRNGLPQSACYFTVLRQAMAVDCCVETGLYFGTNSGSIFASLDEGDSWSEIARHLPTILCVETLAD
ncbi:Ycf48-like protein [Pelagimonas phthalicica]|uniref:Ycf48-like protein n=1 Tax=Pelagimonas phthalicica TaxID=1037362 RepID=A0A238JEA8_9RHOB|nr:glycoside hydrolase [Pelagimonas phthalicica]TDS91948.1 BNR/Asp-box repeat protein [Pelagimonas phthalicica]SMX28998.1 Ycf48-like protein [Pelagimonas phthalicica]